MNKISCVIIDDEFAAAENVSLILDAYCPETEVLGMAHSVTQGIKLIKSVNPNIVFLDISMPPEGTGFDLLSVFPNRNFHVVFVTAHDHYGLQAIKEHAFDYLLKPIDFKEVIKTISHYVQLHDNTISLKPSSTEIITLATDEGTHVIHFNDILFCKASGSYTEYYIKGRQTPIIISKTLKQANSILLKPLFVRVHRSYLINLNMVTKFTKEDGGTIFIEDHTIPVSKNYVENLNSLFSN